MGDCKMKKSQKQKMRGWVVKIFAVLVVLAMILTGFVVMFL